MGCTQSRIENEEAVARCKERKQHMKAAVSARNAFAAAHSSYAMALKNTGAALSDYAHGEARHGSHPHHPPLPSSSSSSAVAGAPPPAPLADTLPPPPPPPSNFDPPPAPLQRAATMPEIKLPKPDPKPKPKPIAEEDEELEDENDASVNLRRRRSSRSGSRGGGAPVEENRAAPAPAPAPVAYQQQETYEFFFNVDNMPRPTLSEMEEVSISKEEIDRSAFDERAKRAEDAEEARGGVGKVEKVEAVAASVAAAAVEEDAALAPPPPPEVVAAAGKSVKKGKQSAGAGSSAEGKRVVKSNVSLVQIFVDLDDHFLKASESAHDVSKMLEATRLHYHSNFADNRGNQSHFASLEFGRVLLVVALFCSSIVWYNLLDSDIV